MAAASASGVASSGAYAELQGLPAYEDIPVSTIKRVTASRLLESKTTIPHYYLSVDCKIDSMMKLRAQLNKSLEKEGTKVSVNDFVIKASNTNPSSCSSPCKSPLLRSSSETTALCLGFSENLCFASCHV